MTAVAQSDGGFGLRAAHDGKEVRLAMQELRLTGTLLPVGARLVVRHVFASAEKKPLEVIYAFALPRDAALRRFRVTGKDFSVRSELKPVREAEKEYEAGVQAGSLSTLSKVYGDGLVNLTVGNIRPRETVAVHLELVAGVELRDDGYRFRFPFTLAPGYHPQAHFSTAEPGEGEIELPEEEFGDVILPTWSDDAEGLHRVDFHLDVRSPGALAEVSSPSHRIRVVSPGEGRARIALATDADVPDRDLVVDVRTPSPRETVLAGADREGRGRFAVVIPSERFGTTEDRPRRVVFVLDRSGSMSGAAMAQAKRAVEACLGALSPEDRFGIVAFDDQVDVMSPRLVAGDTAGRSTAHGFLRDIDARGGTELLAGVEKAARLLRPEGGEILVVTDGQVFGTESLVAQARREGVRIHCLGIGSASQDRFLSLLARETGGTSRFLTARERVDRAAVEVFSSLGRPIATEVKVSAEGLEGVSLAPAPADTVFAGTPLTVFGSCAGPGKGRLRIEWDSGAQEVELDAAAAGPGETLKLLQGARLLTDAEMRDPQQATGRLAKRQQARHDRYIESLSREYGLASRRMALVAVVERASDTPGQLPTTQVVPVGMPEDTAFDSYFNAPIRGASSFFGLPLARRMLSRKEALPAAPIPPGIEDLGEDFQALNSRMSASSEGVHTRQADCFIVLRRESPMADAIDSLLDFATRIEPDGGLPGDTPEDRIRATVAALVAFLLEGSTERRGPFAPHIRRLVAFLEAQDLSGLSTEQAGIVQRAIEAASHGLPSASPDADYPSPRDDWDRLARLLA